MQNWSISIFALVTITAPLIMVSGCGTTGDVLVVSGTITFENKPLPDGLITIFPLEGGKANSGPINEGAYRMLVEPGTYKVEISRPVATGVAVPDPDYGIESEQKESIPSRYNANSVLRMKVNEGDSTSFDFELES